MKLNFNVSQEFQTGIERLSPLLDIEQDKSGIPLTAVQGDRIGASLKDGNGVIYYQKKHHFFRELGVFVENAKKSDTFDVTEDGFFKTVGTMINASHVVPTVKTVHQLLDQLALLGYNMLMLYTEDTIKLENYPHMGYMQNAYTQAELRAMDDYAYEYGIEMLPCIECYGHMQKYLRWNEAADIKDTETVLLAREEKTFTFLDELIRTVSSCFRSKRIHIGMDEAWNMGRGKFLDKNGYVEPFEIFREFMHRLVDITNHYGLVPMMWSDMYMRISSETEWPYDEKIVITDELRESVPKEVDLVFWHYGEEPHCDNFMLDKHNQLQRNVIMATGLWDWCTKLPDNEYSWDATSFSLNACRNNNVKEMMTTRWGVDDIWSTLLGHCFTAELCYRPNIDRAGVKERFDFLYDNSYDAFAAMGQFNNIFDADHSYEDYSTRFLGEALYHQDILEGLFDSHVIGRPISQHYKAQAELLAGYTGKWSLTVERARWIFEVLAIKTEIAQKLHPAYQSGDRETLKQIACDLLPALIKTVEHTHNVEFRSYMSTNKEANWSQFDLKYGMLNARAKTAKYMLDAYLNNEIDHIDSLDEPRLHQPINGFMKYLDVAMASTFF